MLRNYYVPNMEGFLPGVAEICLNNFIVKLLSECDLIFDPEAPPQGLTLGYGVL